MKKVLFTLLAVTTLLLGGTASAALIDDFNGGDFRIPNIDNVFTKDTPYANAIGGWRYLEFIAPETGDSIEVSGGVLTHTEGGTGSGTTESLVRWDGGPFAGAILPPVDLTDGGSSDRMRFVITSVTPIFSPTLNMKLTDDTNFEAEAEFTPDSPGIFDILFSDFNRIGNSDFDFEEVIRLELRTTGAFGNRASSVSIDSISTVPVPGAVWLLGGGLIGLLGLRKRLKS